MEPYTSLLDASSSLLAAVLWEGHRDDLLAAGDELDGLIRNLALECARRSLGLHLQRWSVFFEETTDDRRAACQRRLHLGARACRGFAAEGADARHP